MTSDIQHDDVAVSGVAIAEAATGVCAKRDCPNNQLYLLSNDYGGITVCAGHIELAFAFLRADDEEFLRLGTLPAQ